MGKRSCRPAPHRLGSAIRAVRSGEAGNAAVEFAFVLPVAILLLAGMIQFGLVFYIQNTMAAVANDVVRRVAVQAISAIQGEAMAEERLSGWDATFSVSVFEPSPQDVRIEISVPLAELAFMDPGGFLESGQVTASATMRKE